MQVFDTSRYATGNAIIDQNTVAALARTFKLGVVGAWHGIEGYDAAEASLDRLYMSGVFPATYAALSPGRDDAVDQARDRCGKMWSTCLFCAIDVETDGVNRDQIARASERTVALGQFPIMYTSKSRWQALTGNTSDFRALPLWDARYDGNAALDDFITGTYGGWTWQQLVGKQYTNSTRFDTIDIDYNIFSDQWVTSLVMHKPRPNGLLDLFHAWQADMSDLAANAQSLVATMDPVRLALHTLYTENKNRAWNALLTGGK